MLHIQQVWFSVVEALWIRDAVRSMGVTVAEVSGVLKLDLDGMTV